MKKANHILTIMLMIGILLIVAGQFSYDWIGYVGIFTTAIPVLVMIYFAIVNTFKDIFK